VRSSSEAGAQARTSPVERNASVALDAVSAISCSVATYWLWQFAGMTGVTKLGDC
jgi:hypothetical protein